MNRFRRLIFIFAIATATTPALAQFNESGISAGFFDSSNEKDINFSEFHLPPLAVLFENAKSNPQIVTLDKAQQLAEMDQHEIFPNMLRIEQCGSIVTYRSRFELIGNTIAPFPSCPDSMMVKPSTIHIIGIEATATGMGKQLGPHNPFPELLERAWENNWALITRSPNSWKSWVLCQMSLPQ